MTYDKWGTRILSSEERRSEKIQDREIGKIGIVIVLIALFMAWYNYKDLSTGPKVLMSGDNLNNICTRPYVKEYEQKKEYPYWCPYTFGGMSAVYISNPMFNYGATYNKVIYPITWVLMLFLPMLFFRKVRRRIKIWYYLKVKRIYREDSWVFGVALILVSEAFAHIGYAVYLLLTWKF